MRVLTRVVCAVLAIVGLAAAALVLVETFLALANRPPWLVDAHPLVDAAAETTWSSAGVRVLALLLLVVAALILALALARRPVVAVPALTDRADAAVRVTVRRADLESHLAARLAELPFVTGAVVAVRPEHVQVVARSTRPDSRDVTDAVTTTSRAIVAQLGLDAARVRVRVTASERRAA